MRATLAGRSLVFAFLEALLHALRKEPSDLTAAQLAAFEAAISTLYSGFPRPAGGAPSDWHTISPTGACLVEACGRQVKPQFFGRNGALPTAVVLQQAQEEPQSAVGLRKLYLHAKAVGGTLPLDGPYRIQLLAGGADSSGSISPQWSSPQQCAYGRMIPSIATYPQTLQVTYRRLPSPPTASSPMTAMEST